MSSPNHYADANLDASVCYDSLRLARRERFDAL